MNNENKTAVYIGSFDPFHNGHLEVISLALHYVNRIIIIVSTNKNKIQTPILIRYQMVKYLFHDSPNIDVTIDLEKYLLPTNIGIIGSDIIKPPKWNPEQWIIVERPDYPIIDLPNWITNKPIIIKQRSILSSTYIRSEIQASA